MDGSSSVRRRIGLALSGGGFRATLFHLGVIRFLRDADLLSCVSHITAVSGGSVLAAHLTLNWNRYNGSPDDFDAAAAEIIRFVQRDVRNRIIRRLPLALPIHAMRWLVRLPLARSLTRSGMLEQYYENELYGQRCLYELPETPELHLLATNLGEGALCSFTRGGVIMQKRLPGKLFHFEKIHSGLGTVALAVAASSAFPGFFPPLLVHGQKIGAIESQFRNQLFTDGGIFDNLGIRMFRNIERNWLSNRLLQKDDFYDVECVMQTLEKHGENADAVTKRVRDLYRRASGNSVETNGNGNHSNGSVDKVIAGLQQLMVKEHLYQDEVLSAIKPDDAEAETLLKTAKGATQELNARDRIWLNRKILETALRHATGGSCMRPNSSMFDAVLVSDAGKQFEPAAHARVQGLITTALRASDILMDRVWQLESEAFTKQPGFIFVSSNHVVSHEVDPTALHPEIQRQVAGIRTDLDRFTPLEISSLVQHGYCVARSCCLESRTIGKVDSVQEPPWNPILKQTEKREATLQAPIDSFKGATTTTITARLLERSKQRKIWSRLLDWRDWVSYLYLPIFAVILLAGPFLALRFFQLYRSNSEKQALLEVIAGGSEDYHTVSHLLEYGIPSDFSDKYQFAEAFPPVDYEGFDLISETQVYDQRQNLRQQSQSGKWQYYTHRRYRVARTSADHPLQLRFRVDGAEPQVHCPNSNLNPQFSRLKKASDGWSYWQLSVDLLKVPAGEPVDVVVETMSAKQVSTAERQDWTLEIMPPAKFGIISMWVLLPSQAYFTGFDLYERASPEDKTLHKIRPTTGNAISSGSVIAWSLVNPEARHIYQCHWVQAYAGKLQNSLRAISSP
jgi:predicted acylesterase/phospholipase RssA